jgi:general secretion pathway protein K
MRKRLTYRSGFVIIVVLALVMLLTVLLFGLNYRSRANLRAVDYAFKRIQALNYARAGLNIAIAAIKNTENLYANKNLLNMLSKEHTFELDNGYCSIVLLEESGKLNVNLLKEKSGKLNRVRIDQMLRLIDSLNQQQCLNSPISYSLVPAIIDWIDSDDEVTCLPFVTHNNMGVESDYYGNLDPPYHCKNEPLNAIDEILLVKAMTPQILDLMRDYLTVYGNGKTNINCAPKPVIQSLSEKIDSALAQMIVDRRQIKSFENIAELRHVPGMTDDIYSAISKIITVSPEEQYYSVTSQGDCDGLRCTIATILTRNPATKSVEVILYKEL